ncbi:MAG: hypothetical protein AB1540_09155 [Bdellovibrionota bacterium]
MLKQKKQLARLLKTFAIVSVAGVPLVLASVPRSSEIANDTAIYQSLHEINVKKVKAVDFENDIDALSAQEKSHRLPLRISAPMKRVMETPYKNASYPKRANKLDRSGKRYKRSQNLK